MSQRATIKNCNIGINLQKGGVSIDGKKDWGLIDVNCANFLYNKTGIEGEDILLALDAYVHLPMNCFVLRPNRFECNPDQILFDVCYVDRDIKKVHAKGNFWNDANLPEPLHKINNGQCWSHFSNVVLDFSKNVANTPVSCPCKNPFNVETDRSDEFPIDKESFDDNSCIYEICYKYKNGSSFLEYCSRVEIMRQFQDAYSQFIEGENFYSNMLFAYIRNAKDIPNDDICAFYVQFARVISENMDDPWANIRGEGQLISQHAKLPNISKGKIDEIYPYPNPTYDGFTIALEDRGNYEMKITNELGSLIAKVDFKDHTYFDMTPFTSGIYFINVVNTKTLVSYRGKVVFRMF